ncbi:MAG: CoB--CoM heterodisulfide reductase iron-sulfur subunit A family protein [Promethearchaeota archaeon]|nr:MAG: CoB--CoM heterodisulfide reductase iron-sulfur subunit A family protein [Candidatus Lokiarchaeota archaeon]
MSDKEEEPRIGVFVCSCGSNIGGLIDVKALAEYSKTLPNVVFTEDNLYTCSETGLAQIKNGIKDHNLNRVIVASCTPRTHEPLFRDCVKKEGVNEYLFNFVNIRDQNTWCHQKYPQEAFEKAKDLIRMGVAKAAKLEALDNIIVDATPTALVIGGGVSGMTAALSLANQGFETHLVERENELGGRLKTLHKLFPNDQKAQLLLDNLKKNVGSKENLKIHTSAQVKNIEGFVGNFEVSVEENGNNINLTIGVILVAVGTSLFTPTGYFGYDGKIRITQHELESKLNNNDVKAKDIVMIQCVGSRNDERVYCSSVCCMTALKNALVLKENNPKSNVSILFRDLYTPGTHYEDYYRRAREEGVVFIEYSPEKEPSVEENQIKVYNQYLGEELLIPYDLCVLSTPLVSNNDNKALAQMIKVPLEENGFFLEAHVKLRPMDFATAGVFICGSAKWPVDITESISQGYAAAARASTIISHDTIEVEGATSFLPDYNKSLCTGCEVCIKVCPYNAISKNEEDEIVITQVLCKGCGVCGATCTNHAIIIRHFTDQQILSEIYAYGGKEV